jgi:hypothetical protein
MLIPVERCASSARLLHPHPKVTQDSASASFSTAICFPRGTEIGDWSTSVYFFRHRQGPERLHACQDHINTLSIYAYAVLVWLLHLESERAGLTGRLPPTRHRIPHIPQPGSPQCLKEQRPELDRSEHSFHGDDMDTLDWHPARPPEDAWWWRAGGIAKEAEHAR